MKRLVNLSFLLYGLAFGLAAFPVFAQEEPVNGPEISKKSLIDFADLLKRRVSEKRVDLSQPFLVELDGVLQKDGKLDVRKSRFVRSEGDEEMIDIGKNFIEAINNSGMLGYLQNLGAEKIKLTLAQDNNQSYLKIIFEQKSPERAKTVAAGLNSMFRATLLINKDKAAKMNADELFLLKGAKVNVEGNNVVLSFDYQKSDIQEMINRKLESYNSKAENE